MVGFLDLQDLINNPPFELTDVDKEVLNTAPKDFVPHTWDGIRAIIAAGDLGLLKRSPSDLLNYILWTRDVQASFGSATNFIMHRRLKWKAESISSTPFAEESDYSILRNDWPYGMTLGMVHLVVWSKTPIDVDEDGDPTPESRRLIIQFLDRTFGMEMRQRKDPEDNIQWFRNRVKWQSVRTLEHIHVILRGAEEGFLTRLTGQRSGDISSKAYAGSMVGW